MREALASQKVQSMHFAPWEQLDRAASVLQWGTGRPTRHIACTCSNRNTLHKLPKRHARIVNCWLNLLLTLANKIQFGLARRFFIQEGLTNKIQFGPIVKLLKKQNFVNCQDAIYEISYVKLNSFMYKSNYVIFLNNNKKGDPVIGIISRIVKTTKNNALLVYKKCETIGLDNHTKCCVIQCQILIFVKNI